MGEPGARRLPTLDYLDNVSAPNAESLARAQNFYASHVRRFGRTETLRLPALPADKRRFAQRWPERRYAAQPGCDPAPRATRLLRTCIAASTFDYRAQNPARGTRSQAVSASWVRRISFSEGGCPVDRRGTPGRVLRAAGPPRRPWLTAMAQGQTGAPKDATYVPQKISLLYRQSAHDPADVVSSERRGTGG